MVVASKSGHSPTRSLLTILAAATGIATRARKSTKLICTASYQFAATAQTGMTLSRASEGGAVGVDITLDRLTDHVRSVRSNAQNANASAFDEQN